MIGSLIVYVSRVASGATYRTRYRIIVPEPMALPINGRQRQRGRPEQESFALEMNTAGRRACALHLTHPK